MSTKAKLTRRNFIRQVGAYGGCAFTTMTALGLMTQATGHGAELTGLTHIGGKSKKRVLILGAGIAGLTTAYELGKLGFDCVILEPRAIPGGRSMTLRRGDTITETTGASQTCKFDEGLYFNPGPSRFPQWHVTMDYCRELGVEVQPFVNLNENAFYYGEGDIGPMAGKRARIREVKTDLRGYTAELLAKVADDEALDTELTASDKEALLDFLHYEGGLSGSQHEYRGHNRRGYKVWPGGGLQEGELGEPYKFSELLQSGFGNLFHRANEYQYQSQMFTPAGGMDKIPMALAEKVKDKIVYGAQVKEIRRTNPGARVVYTVNGEDKELSGDYCVCTIPPTILRRLQTDFSPMLKNTLNIVPFQNSGKIGMQFKRRFWEEDDRIYGGISWTNLPVAEIWYPSNGFMGKKGIMGGYYVFGPTSDQLGRMTPEQRLEFALSHGEKVHPQYREEFETAFSVNWSSIPHIEGCLAHFPQAMLKTFYPLLIKPEGELYLAASWASHLGGWQAGAFEAARIAVKSIHERTMAS
ncbi:flavin monoamine oxidase family protein [Pelagicoccus sp. NFK12]|uniref:Tryptophan 2-monooxygenase n=1 Tax=Pelagicoccus enzymogenes TaxID=2773457 RepID=A0A927F674_9BACT|nr:flavin monoamine oxidase family protein [Pelagicoccus enzymogenes]MBD5778735.1 flavin monoamine oxidase family protein [Pelagicoccus enzymogenes]MDQ8197518.1 flavin monoamine oxidase family protein [Pelagicoccus enzymogenes]